jgi:hypothetical protein
MQFSDEDEEKTRIAKRPVCVLLTSNVSSALRGRQTPSKLFDMPVSGDKGHG